MVSTSAAQARNVPEQASSPHYIVEKIMQQPVDMYPDVFDIMAQSETPADLSAHQVLAKEVVLGALAEVPLDTISDAALAASSLSDDMFGGEVALEEGGLRTASGGSANFAVNLDSLGMNINESTATLENNAAEGAVSGQIVDNVVSGNSGFTTVVFNSGNQVILQNSLQVNIFSGSTE